MSKAVSFLSRKFPKFWGGLTGNRLTKPVISKFVFHKFASCAPPRPHAASMDNTYTSWKGLIDRRITGRHIGEYDWSGKTVPTSAELVELFIRPEKTEDNKPQQDCIRSTLLFASFAQWFTDSFLRTDHSFVYDDDGNVVRDENRAPLRQAGREKRNTSTHEIDLCQIYGLSEEKTDMLRLKDPARPGLLKFQDTDDGEYPEFLLMEAPDNSLKPQKLKVKPEFDGLHDERVMRSIMLRAGSNPRGYESIFATGLEHSNSTIGNALLNVVFMREHNRVARRISSAHPGWDDDRVFETTRNVMIVLLLKVVVSDYIRHVSPANLPLEVQPGFAEKKNWYRTNRISIEFNLLYRWHGLVPDEFTFLPDPKNAGSFRHNNDWMMTRGIAQTITDFSKERAGRIGMGNTPRFLAGVKTDSIALMRGAKLAPYNLYRERFGLKKAKKFSDVTKDKTLAGKLSDMYGGDIDALEWYVGLFSEDHPYDTIMGSFLMRMVAHDAFTHALTNPLLSKAVFNKETFSPEGWAIIEETSRLDQIINRVMKPGDKAECLFSYVKR